VTHDAPSCGQGLHPSAGLFFFARFWFDQEFWRDTKANAFFPRFSYFASLLTRGKFAFISIRPLVHRTVFNLMPLEAWGATTQAQQERPCAGNFFLRAISFWSTAYLSLVVDH